MSARTWGGVARIAVFFGIVVLALFAAHLLINAGMRRVDTGALGVFNRIVEGRVNASVLITGSSRALNQYDPREISRVTGATAWNIGLNGSQTDMQLAVLRTYLQHNSTPSLLIHNLDAFSFVTSKAGVAFPGWYVPYLQERPIYDMLLRNDRSWQKARYLPLYGHVVQDTRFSWWPGVGALFGRMPVEVRFNGFEPRATAWNEDFEKFKRANPEGVSFPIEPEAVRDLDDLVGEVTGRGGRVLLVYSPVYAEMRQLDRNRAEVFAHFEQVALKHGAVLWDFSQSPLSARRELFYNSQHLNAAGAALFSRDLAQRLAASGLVAHQ